MTKRQGWFNEREAHGLCARGIRVRPVKIVPPFVSPFVAEGKVKDVVLFPTMSIDYYDPEEVFTLFWVSSLKNDFSSFDFDKAFNELDNRFKSKLAEHGYFGWDEYLENQEEIFGSDLSIENFAIKTDMTSVTVDEIYEAIAKALKDSFDFQQDVENDVQMMVDDMDKEELDEKYDELNLEGKDRDEDTLVTMWVDGRIGDIESVEEEARMFFEESSPLPYDMQVVVAKFVSDKMWKRWGDTDEFTNLVETYESMQSPPSSLSEQIRLMDMVVDAVHVTGSLWDDIDVDKLRDEVERTYKREHGR
ncbi:MAG: hypothetical protein ACTSPB_00785 [Candidatus Thorarchaeota archaeon]